MNKCSDASTKEGCSFAKDGTEDGLEGVVAAYTIEGAPGALYGPSGGETKSNDATLNGLPRNDQSLLHHCCPWTKILPVAAFFLVAFGSSAVAGLMMVVLWNNGGLASALHTDHVPGGQRCGNGGIRRRRSE